jgi:hypothetical protein
MMPLARDAGGGKHSGNGPPPRKRPTGQHGHEILERRNRHHHGQLLQLHRKRTNKTHGSLLFDGLHASTSIVREAPVFSQ